jgi:hypothetical protein
MPPGVQKSVRERPLTLPIEPSCWELKSRWTPKCSKSDCKSQNQMARGVFYIIRTLASPCLGCEPKVRFVTDSVITYSDFKWKKK